ncbi:hypothetical protein A7U60_g1135 [Sanghuangporus baumii]|uniref:Uncharacterized protein n=1 Tax=Sanghuangporus baumii TaxID=108892 RepID=A0A9Q5I4H3_SANBA|nr:hypothetical protein A7U60_g1135 [Sanghuangporus baumii]
MPRDIQRGISRLSLCPYKSSGSVKEAQKSSKKWYRGQLWLYGFHFKNRHARLISEKYGLPWKTNPMRALERILLHITATTRTPYRLRAVSCPGFTGTCRIIFFAEDDGRRRLKKSEATPEEIDRVRKVLGLPEGTKPKWYNVYGSKEYDEMADSSEDEDWPGVKRVLTKPVEEEDDSSSDSSTESDGNQTSDDDYDSPMDYESSDSDDSAEGNSNVE